MIKSFAYDVEVLPNFFSVTIVDVNSYLEVFKDACDVTTKNGKEKRTPVPLVQLYSISEIKDKLNTVKRNCFWITDSNGDQLFPMLQCLSQLRPYYDENHVAVRNDMFGYNSSKYDKLMIAALLMYSSQCKTSKELIAKLYNTSKSIISLQDKVGHRESIGSKKGADINVLRNYKVPYTDIDVMSVFALNKVGKGTDAKGRPIFFGKSLKQASINLQWYELLEYELPSISEKDIGLYNKTGQYKGMTIQQVNTLVNKWDRFILDEWIDDMMHYNLNDVFIVCEIIRLYIDEIRLRYNISKVYGIDVLNSSRSNIADKLFIKFYSEFSGQEEDEWQGYKTERESLPLKDVIFPFIKFDTLELQELLDEIKQVTIYDIGKSALKNVAKNYPNLKYLKTNTTSGWFEVKLFNLTYTVATGGLHSQDIPRELRSKLTDDGYVYTHSDCASYYPSLMDVYKIAPAHMNQDAFVKLIHWLKETRVTAKHSKEAYINGIPKDVLAQALKIVINSIYGKLGFTGGDTFDLLAVLKVTINGQLLLLKLCESLELNGIEVMSANTDGIVIKIPKSKKDVYNKIVDDWCKSTGIGIDSEEYKCYIARDISTYIIEELDGKLSYKGALNPKMYALDLQKGYDMPIVAEAVRNYFIYDKSILDTLYDCDNILDFCKTQNISRDYHIETVSAQGHTTTLQRNIRYYVATRGETLYKVHNSNRSVKNNLCSGNQCVVLNTLDDKPIEYRNINYSYYLNEAIKIIDPIKLSISARKSSGKTKIKKQSMQYARLFDDSDFE